jgi:hypothetical protein
MRFREVAAEAMLRRKKLPDELIASLEGLRAVVTEVEAAKDALTGTVPSTRSPGTPLAEGILQLERRLAAAQDLMPAWRHPDVENEWNACDEGVRESLERARRLREDPPELGVQCYLGGVSAGFPLEVPLLERIFQHLRLFRPGDLRDHLLGNCEREAFQGAEKVEPPEVDEIDQYARIRHHDGCGRRVHDQCSGTDALAAALRASTSPDSCTM